MKRSLIFLSLLLSLFSARISSAADDTYNARQNEMISSPEDLLVAPTRIVFQNGQNTASVSLINRSNKVLTYRLSFIRYRMNEEGNLDRITASVGNDRFADEFVRFTPRRVILQPKQAQAVRLLLRKPQDLPAGEYISHLQMTVTPNAIVADSTEGNDKSRISVKVIPLYGVSIPIIVRHGQLDAIYKISQPHLVYKKGAPYLLFDVNKDGLRSLYGTLEVSMSDSGMPDDVIGRSTKFRLESHLSKLHIKIPLEMSTGASLKGGKLTIRLFDAEVSGRKKILDEAVLVVP